MLTLLTPIIDVLSSTHACHATGLNQINKLLETTLMSHAIEGVHCAAATPVTTTGKPDLALFSTHCRSLLDEGCHGIAMLGTTGEANSFSIEHRMALFDAAKQRERMFGRKWLGWASNF